MGTKTVGKKQYMLMATQENSKSNPSPRKVFEKLHENERKAKFKGNHKIQRMNTEELEPNV